MKAMGIDFGLKRIGIALSDETKFLATPVETYHRTNLADDIAHIKEIIQKNKVDEIVCGLPLNTKGEEQAIARETREFMDKLAQETSAKIEFIDERFTSVMAEEILAKKHKDYKKRKQLLDAMAANIILQDYLDRR